MFWTDRGEGYWMISCPRWGWERFPVLPCCPSGIYFPVHDFPQKQWMRKGSAEPEGWPRGWCLQCSAPLARSAQQADPRAEKKMSRSECSLCSSGDSGAGWAFLSNWYVSSGFVSSQRTPAHVLGGSPAMWTSTEVASGWETQDLRQEHGDTALACPKQLWLSFLFLQSDSGQVSLDQTRCFDSRRVPFLQRNWMLIATALNLPELGWDSHQTAAQGEWGWLPAAN